MIVGNDSELEYLRSGFHQFTVRWLLSVKEAAGVRIPPFEDQPVEVHNDIIEARTRMSIDDFHKLLLKHHVKRTKKLRDIVWPRDERNYTRVRDILETDIIKIPKSRRTVLLPWAFDKNGTPYADVRENLEHDLVSIYTSLNFITNSKIDAELFSGVEARKEFARG